jgi:protein TonB
MSAASASRDGADADGLRQYRLSLAREARRYRNYPARAREAGLAGTTELRLVVNAAGGIDDLRLAKSSGHDLLDDAAIEMLRRAATRTPLPESLRGRTFALTLPVIFDLRDN